MSTNDDPAQPPSASAPRHGANGRARVLQDRRRLQAARQEQQVSDPRIGRAATIGQAAPTSRDMTPNPTLNNAARTGRATDYESLLSRPELSQPERVDRHGSRLRHR